MIDNDLTHDLIDMTRASTMTGKLVVSVQILTAHDSRDSKGYSWSSWPAPPLWLPRSCSMSPAPLSPGDDVMFTNGKNGESSPLTAANSPSHHHTTAWSRRPTSHFLHNTDTGLVLAGYEYLSYILIHYFTFCSLPLTSQGLGGLSDIDQLWSSVRMTVLEILCSYLIWPNPVSKHFADWQPYINHIFFCSSFIFLIINAGCVQSGHPGHRVDPHSDPAGCWQPDVQRHDPRQPGQKVSLENHLPGLWEQGHSR